MIVGVRERNEIDVVCVPLVHVQRRAALLRGGRGERVVLLRQRQHCGNAEDTTGKVNIYQVEFLTNRQKRLVSYYKVFRHIYTKGKYREVLPLPSCVCLLIRSWWPDDDDDRRLRGDVGNVADSNVIEEEEEGEGDDEEEGGE